MFSLNLFGKKKADTPMPQPPPQPVQAPSPQQNARAGREDLVNQLEKRSEMLEKKLDHLSKTMAAYLQIARERKAKGDERGALAALKKRKLAEKQSQIVAASIEKYGQAVSKFAVDDLVYSQVDLLKQVVIASNAMKLDEDAVGDVLADFEEAVQENDSIHDMFVQPSASQPDEAELWAALDEAVGADLEAQVTAPPRNMAPVTVSTRQVAAAPVATSAAAMASPFDGLPLPPTSAPVIAPAPAPASMLDELAALEATLA